MGSKFKGDEVKLCEVGWGSGLQRGIPNVRSFSQKASC